jgi:hypothetical protein
MAANNSGDNSPKGNIEPVALPVLATARALGIGTTKLRQLIRAGELRSIRIDRRVLVPRAGARAVSDSSLQSPSPSSFSNSLASERTESDSRAGLTSFLDRGVGKAV